MIYDTIDNLLKYKGMYKNLDNAIKYLISHDVSALNIGKHEIQGNDIYINVMEGMLKEINESVYELHRKYLDLHIDICGSENILFAEYNERNITESYDDNNDYALMDAGLPPTVTCHLDEKHFVICMLDEPHMPLIKLLSLDTENALRYIIKKAVIKIRVD